jgi:hypothetical protein
LMTTSTATRATRWSLLEVGDTQPVYPAARRAPAHARFGPLAVVLPLPKDRTGRAVDKAAE